MAYEKHEREYTLVGATAIFQPMMQQEFIDFYAQFSEIISVIKDGTYYHFQVEGERPRAARQFLQRVNCDDVNLKEQYQWFNQRVAEYEKFLAQDTSKFTLETVLELFQFYSDLIGVAVACLDTLDEIDELNEDQQAEFEVWAKKTRRREEVIYKNGEMKFMPRYLKWLSETQLPEYTADQLWYLVMSEFMSFIKDEKALPLPEELSDRKKLFYVRQYPLDQIEYFSGTKAEKIIHEKQLFASKEEFENIQELQGQTAFAGKASGRVRIIRCRQDMDEFQNGEVLIAPMTEPSYLPIMKRAAAFVTNEGGTLCHAAIVSRELEKPCIIGTKHATHVFTDGDMVEIDAEQGVVRKV